MIGPRNNNLILLMVSSVVAVVFWIGFELARAYYLSTTPEIVEEQMRALNPKIDSDILEQLPHRLIVSEKALEDTLENSLTYTIKTAPISTQSAKTKSNNNEQVSTGSAGL